MDSSECDHYFNIERVTILKKNMIVEPDFPDYVIVYRFDTEVILTRLIYVDEDGNIHREGEPADIVYLSEVINFKIYYNHGVIHRDIEPAIYIRPFNLDDAESMYQFGYLIWCQNGLIMRPGEAQGHTGSQIMQGIPGPGGNPAIEILNINHETNQIYKYGSISTSIIQSVDGTFKNVLGNSIILDTLGVEFTISNNVIVELVYKSQKHFLELSLEAIEEDLWYHPLMNELIKILTSLDIV